MNTIKIANPYASEKLSCPLTQQYSLFFFFFFVLSFPFTAPHTFLRQWPHLSLASSAFLLLLLCPSDNHSCVVNKFHYHLNSIVLANAYFNLPFICMYGMPTQNAFVRSRSRKSKKGGPDGAELMTSVLGGGDDGEKKGGEKVRKHEYDCMNRKVNWAKRRRGEG